MAARMTKENYKAALRDPWGFVRYECTRLSISSVKLADGADLPRSTVRSYFNESRKSPRIPQLLKMVNYILKYRGELDA